MLIKRFFEPLHALVGLVGQVFGGLLVGLALLPSYYLVSATWGYISQRPAGFLNALLLCLSAGLALFLFGDALLLVLILTRFVFRIRNYELTGEFRALPIPLFRTAVYNFLVNIAKNTFLPLVRGTPLLNWFYRGMGAKIGSNTLITTTRIFDCDLIEIGDSCVIGGGVAISAHLGEKTKGILKKVRIGNRVTVGADTIIMPGATIEDNVIIGANSLVLKDAHLEANSVYGGVPVRKLTSKAG